MKDLSYPIFRRLLGALMYEQMQDLDIDAVGGFALRAYPVAFAISNEAYERDGKTIKAFVMRKIVKGHGTKRCIEGDVKPEDKVAIIGWKNDIDQAVAVAKEQGLQITEVLRMEEYIDRIKNG